MFEKVLVLADGDDSRQPAIRRAVECVADGGEIEVLAIVYEPALEGYLGNREIYEPLRQRVVAERRERAAALARAVESEGVRASSKAVWAHPMDAAVAAEVNASGIDLVVAAPANLHQSGGWRGGGLSYSDWQVVTSVPAPLLIVKSDGRAPYRSIVAAVDPFHAHSKPASLDDEILRLAHALQRRTKATLAALHCYLPLEYFGADLARLPPADPHVIDARMQALRNLCVGAGVAAEVGMLEVGTPHEVLRRLQQGGRADLTVMGALARGRIAKLVLGNTAERVLHYGDGDVLLVTPTSAKL